jgi:hypothetical protein
VCFRRQNGELIAKFFVRVLELARELKLLQVGIDAYVALSAEAHERRPYDLRSEEKRPKLKPKVPKPTNPTSPVFGELLGQLFTRYCLTFH